MKQNLIADYLSCILFRGLSFFTYFLPLDVSLFLGRRLGDLVYLFDRKHRLIANANIRKTVANNFDLSSSKKITRKAYQAFGQNIVEISLIPRINQAYLKKYIQFENQHYKDEAFKRGKGVIFLIVHEGNWELSNIICANLGFPFVLFIRDQGFPRLNALLNSYRLKQGSKIIHKTAGVRQLIETLKANQGIGMTVDQGGKAGEIVKFFGKDASMSTGAVKMALKYDCAIIPIFYTRINGPHTKVILDQVFTVTRSDDPQKDLKNNLQRLINLYEKYLRQYPHEYLWTYKIWKYGLEREILILSDGKTGHLRQSEGLAKLMIEQLAKRKIKTNLSVVEIKFRSSVFRFIFNYLSLAKLRCLRFALTKESWERVVNLKPDFIISTGSAISGVNYCLAKENQAKSVVLMRPAKFKKFDLVVIPEHDRPIKAKNVVITQGALNLIDLNYLNQSSKRLEQSGLLKAPLSNLCIGILIGGNSKKFNISVDDIKELSRRIKKSAQSLNADILISTSRRTSSLVEQVIKEEFINYPNCKLLVVANENNNPDVVGGILGLSNIVICSPESISMISEAVAAEKYVLVYRAKGLSQKHQKFLNRYHKQGYIYLKEINELTGAIEQIWLQQPKINSPKDNLKVSDALNKIL
ncbi:MAG: ELM1/GtrOC1 family putative glycosyltransferase [Candidatus Omnitrophota bacterium]